MNWKYVFFLIYGIPFLLNFVSFIILKCQVPIYMSFSMCSNHYYGMKNDMINAIIPIAILIVAGFLRKMKIIAFQIDSILLIYFFFMEYRDRFIQFFNLIHLVVFVKST
jgi:hypothetical protein